MKTENGDDFDFEAFLDEEWSNIGGAQKAQDDGEEQEPEAGEAEAKEPDAAEAGGTEAEAKTDEDDGDKGGGKAPPDEIPYKRFAQTARERQEFKRRVLELEAENAELKKGKDATQTAKSDEEFDKELADILADVEGDGTKSTIPKEVISRITALEADHADRLYEAAVAEATAKHPGVTRDWLVQETIRTGGKFSPQDLADQKAVADQIVEAEALARFLEEHPDLAEAYKAKKAAQDGKPGGKQAAKPASAPSLKKAASGTVKPGTDPSEGESNDSYLSRLWDQMQG